MKLLKAICLVSLLVVAIGCGGDSGTGPGGGEKGWSSLGGSGADGTVYALFVHGGDLYAGGEFSAIGGVAVQNVARWDGTAWSALGSGLPGRVSAITEFAGKLTAAYQTVDGGGRVVRWTGTAWEPLGEGAGGIVRALAVYRDALIVGGRVGYDDVGVGMWDGTSWRDLPKEFYEGPVEALAVFQSSLFAAGNTISGIARWDGNSWTQVAPTSLTYFNGSAFALAASEDALVVGGNFLISSREDRWNIARFHENAWHPLAAGIDGPVRSLAFYEGSLIAGGEFGKAGNATANNIARWNGTSWSALGSGVNFTVHALAVYDGALVAGGAFTEAGGETAHGIAIWK